MTARGVFGLPQGQRSGAASAGASSSTVLSNMTYPITEYTASFSANANWVQVVGSMPADALVIFALCSFSSGSRSMVELGIGSAGSEEIVFSFPSGPQSGGSVSVDNQMPFSVFVPRGNRLAIRASANALTSYAVYTCPPKRSGMSVTKGGASATINYSGTTWVQIGNTPPYSNGAWIVGVGVGTTVQPVFFGLGASGSETIVAEVPGYMHGYSVGQQTYIPAIWWPPNTRMATRRSGTNTDQGLFQIVETLQ